jgi:hypothetical protein
MLIASTATITAAPVSSTTHAAWKIEEAEQVSTATPTEGHTFSLSQSRIDDGPARQEEAASLFVGCNTTVLPNSGGTSGFMRAPNLRQRFGRSHYLITATELAAAGIGAGTQFGAMGWTFQTAPGLSGSTNLIIYMENTADTVNNKSTTWATAITGMTVVHNGAVTIPNVTGGWDFNFSGGSPFTYTGGGLYIAFDAAYPIGTLSTTTVVLCNATLVGGLKGAEGAAAPTTVAASNFRPETRLLPTNGALNDASVENVQAYGALLRDLTSPELIKAQVNNRGANALSNVPVTLTVTGANPFTDTVIIPALPACTGAAVVTFAAHPHANLGSDTLTVTVPADDAAGNNSKAVPQNVTINKYDYKYPGTIMQGGVGLNAPNTVTIVV